MNTYARFEELQSEVRDYFDAKKVLPKIGGKRPGKKCGGSYIAAEKKCKSHYSAEGKLTDAGKASAQELAGKVRARKGMSDRQKSQSPKGDTVLNLSGKPNGGREGYITTTSYRRKGYSGYLAKISDDGTGGIGRSFINSSDSDRETYQGKMGRHHYKIADLPDGIYEAESKDTGYNTRGANRYHFEVKNGAVTRQFEGLDNAKKQGLGVKPKSEGLPTLEGSDRQVSWANSLREKGLQEAVSQVKNKAPEKYHQLIEDVAREIGSERTSAKDWIDNRSNLSSWLVEQMQDRARKKLTTPQVS